MLRQENAYGCGLYAVANAANMPQFITPERLEISKKGNVIGQLSKWMQDDGTPFYIDAMYYNHFGKKLPTNHVALRVMGEANYLPVIINVQFTEEGKRHLVGAKIDKQGKLYLYDSLKEDVVETTLAKVNKMYYKVFGLFIFMTLDGDYLFI